MTIGHDPDRTPGFFHPTDGHPYAANADRYSASPATP
jgi:hypothetical protein